jgi:hypothetical protein
MFLMFYKTFKIFCHKNQKENQAGHSSERTVEGQTRTTLACRRVGDHSRCTFWCVVLAPFSLLGGAGKKGRFPTALAFGIGTNLGPLARPVFAFLSPGTALRAVVPRGAFRLDVTRASIRVINDGAAQPR